MPVSHIVALCFTGALLVTTAYCVLGSIPLLVLKHDTPLDARFVRGFFNIYYRAAAVVAGATAVSFGVAGLWAPTVGALGLAVLAGVLRARVIPQMEALGAQMPVAPVDAVAGFRRMHLTAIAIALVQLAVIVWALVVLRL